MRMILYLLGDFTQRSSLFAEVHYKTDTTSLGATYTLLDCEDEIRFAGANVRSEDIRTIA
jgi:hypothetical protein